MVARPFIFNGGPDKLDLIQILISEIKLFLPIPHSLVLPQQSIPKDIDPPPRVFLFLFSSAHTSTPNRRYHTREIDVKLVNIT